MTSPGALRVWVDADACPKAAKEQLIKFALKRKFEVLLESLAEVARPAARPAAKVGA